MSSMIKVSAADFQRNIGRYQDMALVQPIAVMRNGRGRTVMISIEEYQRLKRRDRQVLGLTLPTRTLSLWKRPARRSPQRPLTLN